MGLDILDPREPKKVLIFSKERNKEILVSIQY